MAVGTLSNLVSQLSRIPAVLELRVEGVPSIVWISYSLISMKSISLIQIQNEAKNPFIFINIPTSTPYLIINGKMTHECLEINHFLTLNAKSY